VRSGFPNKTLRGINFVAAEFPCAAAGKWMANSRMAARKSDLEIVQSIGAPRFSLCGVNIPTGVSSAQGAIFNRK
jgi:hypothetical protein